MSTTTAPLSAETWGALPTIDRIAIADESGAPHRWDWRWHEMTDDMRAELVAADYRLTQD